MVGRHRPLEELLSRVRARLRRLRPVRSDADFERLVVELTLTQMSNDVALEDEDLVWLRQQCDVLLVANGTLMTR